MNISRHSYTPHPRGWRSFSLISCRLDAAVCVLFLLLFTSTCSFAQSGPFFAGNNGDAASPSQRSTSSWKCLSITNTGSFVKQTGDLSWPCDAVEFPPYDTSYGDLLRSKGAVTYTYQWVGEGPAPTTMPLDVYTNITAGASEEGDGSTPPLVSASGVIVDDGLGLGLTLPSIPGVFYPSGTYIDGEQKSGLYFETVPVQNGIATYTTPDLTAQANDYSLPDTSPYHAFFASCQVCAVPSPPGNLQIVSATMGGQGYVPIDDNNGVPLSNDLAISPNQAAIKGTPLTVNVTFKSPTGFNGSVDVSEAYYSLTAVDANLPPVNLGVSPATANLNLPAGGTQVVTFTFNSLPASVQPGAAFTIQWVASGDVFAPLHFNVYTVFAAPDAPQLQPWLGVLQDACSWAQNDNSYSNIAQDLTGHTYLNGQTGLFWANEFTYQEGQAFGSSSISQLQLPDEHFYLAKFLATPKPTAGNCSDVANYLCCCANALGLDFKERYLQVYYNPSNAPPYPVPFTTNYLYPIGESSPLLEKAEVWSYHQVCVSDVDLVYDASLSFWKILDPFTILDPPTGLDLLSYYQNLVALPINSITSQPVNQPFVPDLWP